MMKMNAVRGSPLFAIGTVLSFFSCADPNTGSTTTESDSLGTNIVESTEPLWKLRQQHWTLDSVPRFIIPGDPVGRDYFLARVRAVRRMNDGRIVVANRGTKELHVFDSVGTFIKTVGRPGDGPGEFSSVFGLFKCIEDTLVVYEGVRMSVLDSRGEFVRTELIAGRLADGRGNMEGISHDCSAILLVDGQYRPPSSGEGIHRIRQTLFWSTVDGKARDTVLSFPGAEGYPWNMGGQVISIRLPFGKEPVWAVARDRVYFGDAAKHEVSIFDRDGHLIGITRWTAQPSAVAGADWDAYAESYQNAMRTNPSQRNRYPPPDHFPVPEHKPAYAEVIVDGLGYLWVRQYQFVDTFNPAPVDQNWWVFDPEGQWLGSIETPRGLTVMDIQDDYVMGVARGENDVEQVVLYGLNRGSE